MPPDTLTPNGGIAQIPPDHRGGGERGPPRIEIVLQFEGPLNLGGTGRFLQSLNSLMRDIREGTPRSRPRPQIVYMSTGTLTVVVELVGIGIGAVGAAAAVATYLLDRRTAANAALGVPVHGTTSITIVGGTNTINISSEELIDAATRVNEVPGDIPEEVPQIEHVRRLPKPQRISGPQKGEILVRPDGLFVRLRDRPDLFVRVNDLREDKSHRLENEKHYVLDGEAVINAGGYESHFDMTRAEPVPE
jgi:hypothetical protein